MRSTLAAVVLFCLGACSVVPETGLPPRREGFVQVVYELDGDTPVPMRVPMSGPDLTVLELVADPPSVRESWIGGSRYLVAPPGTREVRIACRYVVYGDDRARDPFAAAPRILDAFPGARLVDESVQD